MKLDLKNTLFLLDMFLIVGGEGSSNRNASRDESVEAGDKSVEAGDESIEAGEKTPQSCYNTLLSPTFVPNLVTLAWKMSSGMPKEASSLNGPLCAYLMRQNLHDRTCPRS